MFAVAAVAILLTMALALGRAFAGPTVYDRLLAVNMFGGQTVLMIAVLGFLMGRPDFTDIALAYGLINFLGTMAFVKFFAYDEIGRTDSDQDEDKG